MIGEYYGADINNTAGKKKLDNGEMDALLDFSYKNKARDFVMVALKKHLGTLMKGQHLLTIQIF